MDKAQKKSLMHENKSKQENSKRTNVAMGTPSGLVGPKCRPACPAKVPPHSWVLKQCIVTVEPLVCPQ
jgi:hypothetical protein